MFRSILAATDLTEAADPVVRAAAALANVTGAALHVVHAIDLPLLPYTPPAPAAPRLEAERTVAEERLEAQLERAVPAAREVASADVVMGPVHQVVLARAAEVEADLIVVGPHRLRPFADRFLGSTADRIVRTSPVPVLLVRGALDLPLHRLMVPTDLSDRAATAVEVAFRWAEALGSHDRADDRPAEVQVIHVVPRAYEMQDFAFDDEVIGPELEKIVAEARDRVGHTGAARPRVQWGDLPADEILRTADAEGIDLLVAATEGHGAVRRALLGSVASAIARGAPCPLLLVPPTPTKPDA